MIAAGSDDDGVDGRAVIASRSTDGLSYAAPRPRRRRSRLIVPATAIALGAVLGGAALAVLQLV